VSNPLSAYDFVYKAMTDDERNDLQNRITNIMVASAAVAAETMKKAMENALSDLVVVPFHDAVPRAVVLHAAEFGAYENSVRQGIQRKRGLK
jgi:hypothetical protein